MIAEKFIDILKIFLDKYFINTLVSIVGTIITVAFTPNIFDINDRLDDTSYKVLLFCIYFLLFVFIKFIYDEIVKVKHKCKSKKEYSKSIQEQNNMVLEELWTAVDGFSQKDRDYLKIFLETKNEPIKVRENYYSAGKTLFKSGMVHTVRVPSFDVPIKKYKLKDEAYEALKYSFEKYGRISHFE